MSIKNIIFDLGGVFIDIHFDRTQKAFEQLGFLNFGSQFNTDYYAPLFQQLETGDLSATGFYNGIRQLSGLQMQDHDIEAAWNAMLGRFRPETLNLLPGLKARYQTFLFSNTNAIHYDAFMLDYTRQFGQAGFDDYFHHPYYSHLLGLRKPHPESYLAIVNRHQLIAAETVFIDDSPPNLVGAKAAGLHTLELPPGTLLEDVLPQYLAQNG